MKNPWVQKGNSQLQESINSNEKSNIFYCSEAQTNILRLKNKHDKTELDFPTTGK